MDANVVISALQRELMKSPIYTYDTEGISGWWNRQRIQSIEEQIQLYNVVKGRLS